jgi:3-hydroxyisobutyrate dehydrogenase-like beta-hydroxyacid dehydrogenase
MAEGGAKLIVAVMSPGDMGSAIGTRLARHGATVRTSVKGRSQLTRDRAAADGFLLCEGDRELVDGCDFLVSVIPSGQTVAFAERMREPLGSLAKKPVYIECNPVAPDVVKRTGEIVASAGCPYVDAALIGDPPSRTDDRGPRVYVCGDHAERCLPLRGYGLDIRVLDLPAGAASAIKLSYSALTKGLQALGTAVFARAETAGVLEPFRTELAAGQPHIAAILDLFLPRLPAKAVRWVQEMDQLADYMADERGAGPMFEAMARYYEIVAANFAARSKR